MQVSSVLQTAFLKNTCDADYRFESFCYDQEQATPFVFSDDCAVDSVDVRDIANIDPDSSASEYVACLATRGSFLSCFYPSAALLSVTPKYVFINATLYAVFTISTCDLLGFQVRCLFGY